MTDRALIIFTRNPELGKCKTRLAKSIGDHEALKVYKYLLQHTANVAKNVRAKRFVFYSENIQKDDIWDESYFQKELQNGNDLGERMQNAFEFLFSQNYKKVLIIGSDLLDLTTEIIENAFNQLQHNHAVIGPAEDGGYYLLGLNEMDKKIFINKNWGTETVLEETKKDFLDKQLYVLESLNDIDLLEDLKPYDTFNYLF